MGTTQRSFMYPSEPSTSACPSRVMYVTKTRRLEPPAGRYATVIKWDWPLHAVTVGLLTIAGRGATSKHSPKYAALTAACSVSGRVTVTCAVPLCPSRIAVIVTGPPTLTAVTTPDVETVATEVSDSNQVRDRVAPDSVGSAWIRSTSW